MAVVGWILLGIVLLLLFLLLTILFLPIFYRIIVKMDETGPSVSIKVTWFFHLIRVLFDYPKPKKPIIKIAFFTLSEKKKKDKGEKPAETGKDSSNSDHTATEVSDVPLNEENSSENILKGNASTDHNSPEDSSDGSVVEEVNDKADEASSQESSRNEEMISEEGNKKKQKKSLKETLEKLWDDFQYYKALWEDGSTKPFVKDALSRVLHLLKNLLPRKIKGYVLFGAESPDITGYVFGGYSVFKALYSRRFFLTLEPDFERKVLEGDLLIKGHFCVFTLLLDALRILFDKRLKLLKKKLDARKHPEQAARDDFVKEKKRKRKPGSVKKRKAKAKQKDQTRNGNDHGDK